MEAQRAQVLKSTSFWGTKKKNDNSLRMKALLLLLGFKQKMPPCILFSGGCESAV